MNPSTNRKPHVSYEMVTEVISQRSNRRGDFQVNCLLEWFRKKSTLLAQLKTAALFDIIKHMQFAVKPAGDVIFKQGEAGNCMYIVLRGQVSIYIQNAANDSADGQSADLYARAHQKPMDFPESSPFGTFACTLGAGCSFGEVALLSDDCVRTATIVADEISDLAIVARDLYARSVRAIIERDYFDKLTFVSRNDLFSKWAPRYRKQLTMALHKRSLGYDEILFRQGDDVNAIFFIYSGELRIMMDPERHKKQYPQFWQKLDSSEYPLRKNTKTLNGSCNEAGVRSHKSRARWKRVTELSLLGSNETQHKIATEITAYVSAAGDMELLLGLSTHAQRAVATRPSTVFVLEMKHYARLLIRRNPGTLDTMHARLMVRLSYHVTTGTVGRGVPLLKVMRERLPTKRQGAGRNGHLTDPLA